MATSMLLAEDDTLIAERMLQALRTCPRLPPLDVTITATEEETIEACKTALPDLLIADMVLRGSHGATTLARLHGLFPSLPILVCSVLVDEFETAALIRAGVVIGGLRKPTSADPEGWWEQLFVGEVSQALAAIERRALVDDATVPARQTLPMDGLIPVWQKIGTLEGRIAGVEVKLGGMEADVAGLRQDVRALDTKVDSMSERIIETIKQYSTVQLSLFEKIIVGVLTAVGGGMVAVITAWATNYWPRKP